MQSQNLLLRTSPRDYHAPLRYTRNEKIIFSTQNKKWDTPIHHSLQT